MTNLRSMAANPSELAQFLVLAADANPQDVIDIVSVEIKSEVYGPMSEPMPEDVCGVACVITGLAALTLALQTSSEALAEHHMSVAYDTIAHSNTHGHPLAAAIMAAAEEGAPVYNLYLAATEWVFSMASNIPVANIPDYLPSDFA